MTDILERLRNYPGNLSEEENLKLVEDAADEIERLREGLDKLRILASNTLEIITPPA